MSVTTQTLAEALARLAGSDFTRFCLENGVSLAVLFGSRAGGRAAAGSDIDLGLWLDCADLSIQTPAEARRRLTLFQRLTDYLQTDKVDAVILNRASPLLKFQVARYGKPLFQKTPGLFAAFCSRALREHNDARVFYEATEDYLRRSIKGGRRRG